MAYIKNWLKQFLIKSGNLFNDGLINSVNKSLTPLNWELRKRILSSERYMEVDRLMKHGYNVYSQHDEDGMIKEVFDRIGLTNRFFIEFGVGNGLQNNTLFLLLQGWQGLWIEGDLKNYNLIKNKFSTIIKLNQLAVENQYVTIDNINKICEINKVPEEIDLLSIDIDGNDYYIFKEIKTSARVVIIEYNAKFPPSIPWVIKYNPQFIWDRQSDYFGASLKSLESLFRNKGYSLVGCDISGTNAFFVRNDLLDDKFCEPFSAENHYEPARYWLSTGWVSGHAANFGDFERL